MQPFSSNRPIAGQPGIVCSEFAKFFGSAERKRTTPRARAFSEHSIFTMGASVSAFVKFIK
jgi:hypothetical protein